MFLSNRDAPENAASRNQLYMMRPDGGEARRITDAKEGVSDFAFSPDGSGSPTAAARAARNSSIACRSTALETAAAEQITKHPTGVGTWTVGADSKRIYFVVAGYASTRTRSAPREEVHRQHPQRRDARRQPVGARPRPAKHDHAPDEGRRRTPSTTSPISDDGKWIGFQRQIDQPLRAQHHRSRTSTPTSTCSTPPAARSSG